MPEEVATAIVFGLTLVVAVLMLWRTLKGLKEVAEEKERFESIRAKIESEDPKFREAGWKEAVAMLVGHIKDDPKMMEIAREHFAKERLKSGRPAKV